MSKGSRPWYRLYPGTACTRVQPVPGLTALVQADPVSVQGPHQRHLLKNLLKDYNRMERPVGNDSHSLTVVFSLSLIQIMDVDEKNQVLTTNIWLRMGWFDHYLQWNQTEYPGVKNLRFTPLDP
ncbi:unnamed protein product [Arctogadus glacialis]